mmetsp:Transcript_37538/g.55889  ORF Transcript_37538/g.55889 Transcript_37538/m.55889 type:complete len:102 (+) Transcript_37538:202-507(+)
MEVCAFYVYSKILMTDDRNTLGARMDMYIVGTNGMKCRQRTTRREGTWGGRAHIEHVSTIAQRTTSKLTAEKQQHHHDKTRTARENESERQCRKSSWRTLL